MDLDKLGIFHLASRRIGYLAQRQTVLAENIANADTPGYRPNDLQPFAEHMERAGTHRLPTAQTHPMHLAGHSADVGDAPSRDMGEVYEAAPSGNEVVLEQQMLAVADTAAQHQLALNLYRKHMGMLRMAFGRGR
jgi:flagellar basal-body rod protein FlgB